MVAGRERCGGGVVSGILELRGIARTYVTPAETVHAVVDLSMTITAGEMVALMGPSGSGKSTVLLIAGLLLRSDTGEVLIGGEPAPTAESEQARVRNQSVGFVHQGYAVVDAQTALENVMIPLEYARPRIPREIRRARAKAALARLGIDSATAARKAKFLSGGQRQRVAIARALVMGASLVLADEPTASLDHATADIVLDHLSGVCSEGAGVLIATHDPRVAERCHRVIRMEEGVIVR